MNILITGCAGFIASHIIEELLKDEPTQPKNELSQTKPISPYGYEKLKESICDNSKIKRIFGIEEFSIFKEEIIKL